MSYVNSRNPLSPSVVKFERDYGAPINAALTHDAIYVGAYEWGPACEPTKVYNKTQLLEKFGRPRDWNYLHWFAVADYLAYSAPVCLIRAIDDNTFNAYAGNTGSNFSATVQVINGEVEGVTYQNYGTGYSVGDIIPLETTHDVVETAVLIVKRVDPFGAITEVEVSNSGKGYIDGDVVTPGKINVQIKNDDDFLLKVQTGCSGILENSTSLSAFYPSVIARYPGTPGNQLIFSTARASDFEDWEYKEAFAVAPSATVVEYALTENQNVVTVDPQVLSDWQNDWVVTVNSTEIIEGTTPGTYTKDAANNTITLNVDTEYFTGDNETTQFVLANVFNLPTTNVVVKVNDNEIEQWSGDGLVPEGYVRVNGEEVTFGSISASTSGDGANTNYRLNFGSSVIDTTDLKIFVAGQPFTVITTGTPAVGEVLVTTSTIAGNNVADLEFEPSQPAPNGTNNIIGQTGFLDATDNIEVSYNYPEEGSLKIFSDQNEIHAVVATKDGTFGSEAGEILEAYPFASLVPGTKSYDGSLTYYKDLINKRSNYIWISNDLLEFTTVQLSGGTDSLEVNNPELIEGWELVKDPDQKEGRYLIGGPADPVLANWLIDNILECRCDLLGAFSPRFEDVVCTNGRYIEGAISWRQLIHSTSFAVTEGNWKLRYDEFNDVYRWVPLNPDTLGIIAASNQEFGEWVSPAGEKRGRYKNLVRLAYSPNKNERDQLYPNDINPVYDAKKVGPILYGTRTLVGRNSGFRDISDRMLFIMLEQNLVRYFKEFLFEKNTEATRRRAFNIVNPWLRNLLGSEAFDDYKLVIDETNNGPEVLNRNQLCGALYIRPNASIENVCLDFIRSPHGITFEEIQESQRLKVK